MITPLRNRFLLRPLEDKQSGSIVIPEDRRQSQTAEIVALPTDCKFPLKPGDVVMFHPNAAWTNVEIEGEELRVMNEEYLLAKMETV